MFFLMRCIHHSGQDEVRNENRSAHRAWVRSGGDGLAYVLVGSALNDENGTATGNFGILEAANRQDAEAFAIGDPFNAAGIVSTIELVRLPDSFPASRISEPMTRRLPET